MIKTKQPEHHFDGATYEPEHDQERLSSQFEKTRKLMSDGCWHTIREIHAVARGSEQGVSARIRDLRKKRNGGHQVQRRRISGGLFEYRLVVGDIAAAHHRAVVAELDREANEAGEAE